MNRPIPKRLRQSPAYHAAPDMEQETAHRIGGHTTAASGSGAEKADARKRGKLRVECKGTSRKSFAVTRKMLDKLNTAAELSGELPVLQIKFLSDGKHPGCAVLLVPDYMLEELQTLHL